MDKTTIPDATNSEKIDAIEKIGDVLQKYISTYEKQTDIDTKLLNSIKELLDKINKVMKRMGWLIVIALLILIGGIYYTLWTIFHPKASEISLEYVANERKSITIEWQQIAAAKKIDSTDRADIAVARKQFITADSLAKAKK